MTTEMKVAEADVVPGRYKVKADFASEDDSQLSVKEGEYVIMQAQKEDRGWVWAQTTDTGRRAGYVPRNYLEKIPEGDWDQWAYGCEIVSCFYAGFSGMFILLYGSATKTDPTMELAIGTLSMMLASVMMIVIFFRNSIKPIYRALYLGGTSIFLFAGYPLGVWGGITLMLSSGVEVLVWYSKDDPYNPPSWSIATLCRSIFAASFFTMIGFGLWLTSNVFIFIWGLSYGRSRADDWNDLANDEVFLIPRNSWGFAQGMAQCICYQITVLLVFALQGFQQVILACTNFDAGKQGKMSQFKKGLTSAFSRDSMLAIHKFISFTMLFCGAFHVLGCFAAYEHSGPAKDFRRLFGDGPIITGGLLIILLAMTLSSTYLSPDRQPQTFRYVHLTSVLFIGLLVLHGKNWFAPNFYKWLIGPIILYAMDKSFRFGFFGFDKNEDV